MVNLLIVIPTYNERENIVRLIDLLVAFDSRLDILVVDDASPDGTSERVKSHSLFGTRVFLLERSGKKGRGSACIDGFRYGINRGRYEYIIEMDADFSHDPRDLRKFFSLCMGYDVVIGSRYVKGSRIVGWGLKRRIFSRFANVYARLFLRVPILDYTNGFRCYKTEKLRRLDFNSFQSSGYITLSEIAYKLYRNGCTFAEVPITFVNRKRGASSLSFKEIKEAFLLVPKLCLWSKSWKKYTIQS